MDCTELRTLSLFSGVGMLDLGITAACEWLGLHHRCQGYAEWDAYAADKLLARMEDEALEPTPVWTGCLSELDASELRGRVDLVTAGPPCQPFSSAGKRVGIDDPRAFGDDGLGPLFHLCRIVAECRPALVFIENVPEFVSGGHFRSVGEELSRLGFHIESPLFLTAKAVGASHKRERVFVLAHAEGTGRQLLRRSSATPKGASKVKIPRGAVRQEQRTTFDEWSCDSSSGLEHAARTGPRERPGRERRLDAGAGLGNPTSNDKQRDSVSTSDGQGQPSGRSGRGVRGLGDAERAEPRAGETGGEETTRSGRSGPADSGGVDLLFAPGRYADHISRDPVWQGILAEAPHLAPAVEPGFRQLVDGLPVVLDASRADQLRCVGNGCVPLQAAVAFVALLERAGCVGRDQK